MEKQICAGEHLIPLREKYDLIQKILVLVPVESLLRIKSVCKPWRALIETSSFIDLYFNSSSNKFGSFILHAAVDFERFRENALLMVSLSVSESRSGSFGLWSTGFNGVCGRCESCRSDSGSGGWWSTNDGLCAYCGKWNPATTTTNNYYLGGGGGGGGGSNVNDELVLKLDNLGFPSRYQFDKIKPPIVTVVGSCNGLICLYDEQPNEVSLWNPATRQFRILPKPSSSSSITGNDKTGGDVHRLFAFGFDAETKDYKVVLLSVSNRRMLDFVMDGPVAMKCICQVHVYSLSTDSWRLLEGITCLPGSPFPYPPVSSSSEVFYLNGCCFFMAKILYSEQCIPPPPPKMEDRFLISLDLTKETITPIKLPYHHPREQLYLCFLDTKIALFTKRGVYTDVYHVGDPNGSFEIFDIWVSSNVDDDESFWKEIRSFEIRLGIPGERNIPRAISNDGVFVLLETEIGGGGLLGNKKNKKKMKMYNLVTSEVKKNFLSCDQILSKAYAYKPSLVSIIGNAAAGISQPMIIG